MKCTKCGNTLYNRPKSRMCWGCEKKDTTLPDHLRINPKYYTTKNTATKNGTLKERTIKRAFDLSFEVDKLRDENKELQKYKKFHDHIKSHFEKEHPDWEVCCKICKKTFKEIVEDA